MPDGKKTRLHPLLWCLANRLGERTKKELATALGVRSQSLYKWETKCKADRHFPLPAERAQGVAGFFDVPPELFRPDLFAAVEVKPKPAPKPRKPRVPKEYATGELPQAA